MHRENVLDNHAQCTHTHTNTHTHSLAHSLTHSLTHTLTRSHTHSLLPSFSLSSVFCPNPKTYHFFRTCSSPSLHTQKLKNTRSSLPHTTTISASSHCTSKSSSFAQHVLCDHHRHKQTRPRRGKPFSHITLHFQQTPLNCLFDSSSPPSKTPHNLLLSSSSSSCFFLLLPALASTTVTNHTFTSFTTNTHQHKHATSQMRHSQFAVLYSSSMRATQSKGAVSVLNSSVLVSASNSADMALTHNVVLQNLQASCMTVFSPKIRVNRSWM